MSSTTSSNVLLSTREQLRVAIAGLGVGNRRRYPPALRARIARYARGRIDAGGTRAGVCIEIGVSDPTLTRILDEYRPCLVAVEVAQPSSTATTQPRTLVLRTPGGLVVEGLGVADVASLLRALA